MGSESSARDPCLRASGAWKGPPSPCYSLQMTAKTKLLKVGRIKVIKKLNCRSFKHQSGFFTSFKSDYRVQQKQPWHVLPRSARGGITTVSFTRQQQPSAEAARPGRAPRLACAASHARWTHEQARRASGPRALRGMGSRRPHDRGLPHSCLSFPSCPSPQVLVRD